MTDKGLLVLASTQDGHIAISKFAHGATYWRSQVNKRGWKALDRFETTNATEIRQQALAQMGQIGIDPRSCVTRLQGERGAEEARRIIKELIESQDEDRAGGQKRKREEQQKPQKPRKRTRIETKEELQEEPESLEPQEPQEPLFAVSVDEEVLPSTQKNMYLRFCGFCGIEKAHDLHNFCTGCGEQY